MKLILPALLFLAEMAFAQSPLVSDQPDVPAGTDAIRATAAAATDQTTQPATYKLGPGDQVTLTVADLEDFNDKTFRIDMHGDLTLPLAGRVHAAGLTINQLEAATTERLRRLVKDPDVVISIASFGSQPVSILGAVANPGIRQLEGQKTLFEVLSLAGGLRPDAGNTVHITRDLKWGALPLADAKNDETGRFSVASLKVKDIMTARDPAENIVVEPGDIISIPKAEMVYAVGSVIRPGDSCSARMKPSPPYR